VLAGFLGGCAVLTEYPLVLTQFLVVLYLLTGPDRWNRAIRYCLGALPLAIAMFAYNKAITGKFLDFPYNHVGEMWSAMHTAFGLRLPSGEALLELMFGQYRGLAAYCTALLVCVPWIWNFFDGPRRRRNLVVVLMGSYLLLISSYFKWDGGWATGPRHLMPLVALGIYEGLGALTSRKQGYFWFLLFSTWGMVVSVVASATDPLPGEDHQHPIFEVFFPKLLHGEIADHSLPHEWGLPNGAYLVPLWGLCFLLLIGVLGWMLARELHTAPARPRRAWALAPAVLPLAVLVSGWVHQDHLPPTWTSSGAFVKDHWRTSGSTNDHGPYHLLFHTDEQDNPWVVLDLHSERTLEGVEVTNREDCCKDRAVPLIVETSNDQKTWTQVAERKEVFDTWRAEFAKTEARYVRLRVPRKTTFHLRDIEPF
jgi:hypothetical protein